MKKHHTMKASMTNGILPFVATAVAIAEPIMTIPQAYKIWHNQSAQNISLVTWIFSLFSATVWFIYGLKIKNKPVIVSSICWMIIELVVIAGIFTFKP